MEQRIPLLRADGVTKVYDGPVAVTAVAGVNFTVSAGEFLCLAGPSGSGKTTLLTLLGGLDRPTGGTVLFEGTDLSALPAGRLSRLRLRRMGFVFQELNLIPVLTAWENVEFPLLLRKTPKQEARRQVAEILAELNLTEIAHRRPSAMSGGQQQRVAVARAVVGNPSLILADEPTANLDSQNAADLIGLMKRLNATRGTTFIIATHDPRVISRADRTVHLRDGRIADDTAAAGRNGSGSVSGSTGS